MENSMSKAFVDIFNSARRILNGNDEWNDFIQLLQRGMENSEKMRESLNFFIPTISRESGVQEINDELIKALDTQYELLEKSIEIAQARNIQELPMTMSPLDDNAVMITNLVAELENKKKVAFRTASSNTLNDIILIGMEVSRKKIDSEQLKTRLPGLQKYIEYVESTLERLKKRFSTEEVLIKHFKTQVDLLKQGAGGIFVFLNDGKISDLVVAISLLDRVGMDLWAGYSALNQLYIQHQDFSDHPIIDDAYHIWLNYKDGKSTKEEMIEALRRMKIDQEQEAFENSQLETEIFIKKEIKEKFITIFKELNKREELVIAYMYENIEKPELLEEGFKQYNLLFKKRYETRQELDKLLKEKTNLSDASHFDELLHLIRQVYESHIPDVRLEHKYLYLNGFQEEFRRRLTLESRRSPEVTESANKIFSILDKQKEGFDMIAEYLQTGNKEELLKSYNIIEESTKELLDVNTEINKISQEEEIKKSICCPFCSTENVQGAKNCAKCGRFFPNVGMGQEISSSSLNFTDTGEQNQLMDSESSENLPDNISFIKQVIEQTADGAMPFEEGEELLMPYFDGIHKMEKKLNDTIGQMVTRLNNPELTEYFENLKDSISYYKDVMATIIQGMEENNPVALTENLPAILEASEEFTTLSEQLQNSMKTKA